MKEAFISVVIPMYNAERTISACINAILNQTAIKNILEIIVVNDGSVDSSREIVMELKEKTIAVPIVLVDKENGGVSSARNAGLAVSKGDWIALCDSDDEWLPEKTEIQCGVIYTHEGVDFLGGDIDKNGLKILFKRITGLHKATLKELCIKSFPQTSTAIFRKKVFDEIGGFDESQRYAEDGNFFQRVCVSFSYYHLPMQMVIYDGGKKGFGESGLSANLAGMYKGNIKNIRELRHAKHISLVFYLFLRVFYLVKYNRRIILTRMRSLLSK